MRMLHVLIPQIKCKPSRLTNWLIKQFNKNKYLFLLNNSCYVDIRYNIDSAIYSIDYMMSDIISIGTDIEYALHLAYVYKLYNPTVDLKIIDINTFKEIFIPNYIIKIFDFLVSGKPETQVILYTKLLSPTGKYIIVGDTDFNKAMTPPLEYILMYNNPNVGGPKGRYLNKGFYKIFVHYTNDRNDALMYKLTNDNVQVIQIND